MKHKMMFFPVLALCIAILACQVISTDEPTPLPTYTPQPTYTPYPSLTPEPQSSAAGVLPFALTTNTFAETDEIEDACAAALGSDWRLADWLDILEFYDAEGTLDSFITSLGGKISFMLTFEGQRWYSEQRHYFVEVHQRNLPEGWLSHADIDDHLIDLGSWFGLDAPILCFLGEERVQIEDQTEDSGSANTTPETPPTFELSFHGTQPCGEWPHYAVFEVESSSIWILQSSFVEIHDNTNNKSVYSGSNDQPFLKEKDCPPGNTILPPFNTRFVAANIQSPEPGTEFSAAITLCTEDSMLGECATEMVDFVFDGETIPFVGVWKNEATGMILEISNATFAKKFSYEGAPREIIYNILAYDVAEGHLDLLTDRVLQGGQEVEYDWAPEQYLSYIITDNVMKMFIGPNPYPIAASGVSYKRQENDMSAEDAQAVANPPAGNPSFDLTFAGTHSCSNWPNYAAFQVENTSEHTFESVSLNIQDVTNDKRVYGGSNDRGFVAAGACPPGDSTLPPNGSAEVAANIREPEAGTEFEATIKLCTQDGLEGDCVTHKVSFTFEE